MASAPSRPGHAARGLFVLGAREEDVQKLGPSWICAATHTDSLKTRGLPRKKWFTQAPLLRLALLHPTRLQTWLAERVTKR